jgi:hypothetical protein
MAHGGTSKYIVPLLISPASYAPAYQALVPLVGGIPYAIDEVLIMQKAFDGTDGEDWPKLSMLTRELLVFSTVRLSAIVLPDHCRLFSVKTKPP